MTPNRPTKAIRAEQEEPEPTQLTRFPSKSAVAAKATPKATTVSTTATTKAR